MFLPAASSIGLAVVSFGVGALMALSKSKKHYIGLTWDDGGAKGGVAFLEVVTGKKAVKPDAIRRKLTVGIGGGVPNAWPRASRNVRAGQA